MSPSRCFSSLNKADSFLHTANCRLGGARDAGRRQRMLERRNLQGTDHRRSGCLATLRIPHHLPGMNTGQRSVHGRICSQRCASWRLTACPWNSCRTIDMAGLDPLPSDAPCTRDFPPLDPMYRTGKGILYPFSSSHPLFKLPVHRLLAMDNTSHHHTAAMLCLAVFRDGPCYEALRTANATGCTSEAPAHATVCLAHVRT